ncbi:alpha/beta-hydrolase [Myriangium duriaei CBS 260.36]|uniref:Alpha/beta-hydrolase n=1 Tax=Myriangium duriaei CBS 260.36 TaxID=1168546 RepID=A0A9P4MQB6_9PEZI|nr:alpha/beta-hydrolase [Myriangium duriaei CBS 260.36]
MLLTRARPLITRSALPLFQPRFSSTTSNVPLDLAYDSYPAPEGSSSHGPIVFLHGLFGSKKNNRTIAKALARSLSRPIYNLDLRNHGDSPHSPVHTYTSMSSDVEHFLRTHRLSRPTLIGHSMGAKVAMSVCLRRQVPVANLISVDNAPVDAALKSSFGTYIKGMKAIAAAEVTKLSEADEILKDYEEETAIRQFLLTNLVRDKETGVQKWRVPVGTLAQSLDHMADFPFREPDEVRWEGEALFVRGTKSHYVSDEVLPITGRFFPKFKVMDVDCGHWVISEKPEDFKRGVEEFLADRD